MGDDGKDLYIAPGHGNGGAPDGAIVFHLADMTEVLRFDPDGTVFVRGEKVDDNAEVYAAFRAWLAQTGIAGPGAFGVLPQ